MFNKKRFVFFLLILFIFLSFGSYRKLLATSQKITYSVGLHGIGSSGDTTNPTNFQFSNKNPVRTSRQINVVLTNSSEQIVATLSGMMNFNTPSGLYTGEVEASVSAGTYFITLYAPGYLQTRFTTSYTIASGAAAVLPVTHFVAGDADNDNKLSVLDYNVFIGCYSDISPAKNCTPEKKLLTDITDDGKVNLADLNLFLRELKVR